MAEPRETGRRMVLNSVQRAITAGFAAFSLQFWRTSAFDTDPILD